MRFLRLLATCLILISTPVLTQAQSKTFPPDLELLAFEKLVELGPHNIKDYPCYGPEGTLLSKRAISRMQRNPDYRTEYFGDSSGKLVAIKFKKVTEEEKARMRSFRERREALKALLGTEAADFTTSTLEGKPVDLSELRGSVVVINFWFIGCKPCIQEMPELNEIVSEYKDDHIRFIAVALDEEEALRAFLEKQAFDYEIVPKGRSIAKLYNVSGYPTHCLIDTDGKITYLKSGYGDRTATELRKNIAQLLKK